MARLWELFGRPLGAGLVPPDRGTLPVRVGDAAVLVLGPDRRRYPVTVDRVDGAEVRVSAPVGDGPDPALWPSALRLEVDARGGPVTASGALIAVHDRPRDTVWTVRVEHVDQCERRMAVRIPVSVPIRLASERRWHEGWTFDVSVGGLRFVLLDEAPVAIGDHLAVSLTLPPAGRVTSTVEAVRVEHRSPAADRPAQLVVGAAFRGDDPVRDAALRAFVAARI